MEYYAGLDVSMEETHICVVDRDGVVIHEAKATSTALAIATALQKAPHCDRVVFETGRMAPVLHHGLNAYGIPVICIESRHAARTLRALTTHKTEAPAKQLSHVDRWPRA